MFKVPVVINGVEYSESILCVVICHENFLSPLLFYQQQHHALIFISKSLALLCILHFFYVVFNYLTTYLRAEKLAEKLRKISQFVTQLHIYIYLV